MPAMPDSPRSRQTKTSTFAQIVHFGTKVPKVGDGSRERPVVERSTGRHSVFRKLAFTLAAVGVLSAPAAAHATAWNTTGASTLPAAESVVPTSPTNAGKIFQWGLSDWEDEFIDPLSSESWTVSHDDRVRNQNGMLTLEGTPTTGRVTATVSTHARRYGRWEARVRSNVEHDGGTPYRVVWELIPARRTCGDGITLATYTVGDDAADMDIRGRSGAAFTESIETDLDDYAWHTYAVEVTPDHISWFVDTKVMMTERRPEALAGNPFRMQFRLEPVHGKRMDSTRMQMDWVRYYTMDRPNALPIEAPRARIQEFTTAC